MLAPTEKLKVFVYGSLRSGFFNYDKYLKGHVLSVEKATIKGKLYHMPYKGYPAIIDGEDTIIGEVMELKDFEKVMIPMDRMEGYYGANNKNNEYTRVIEEVTLESGKVEKCYIYRYNTNLDKRLESLGEYIPSGDWTNGRSREREIKTTA